jgi:iron complex outermembrane receptor protein
VGLSFAVDRGLSLYSNLTTAFETPTTTELANRPNGVGGFNPDISPQTARSIEAGARGSTEVLNYQLSLFTTTIANELIGYELRSSPGRSFFRNAGRAIHRGVEMSVSAKLLEHVELHSAATFLDARYSQYDVGAMNYSNNHVPGIAGSHLALSATIALPLEILLQPEFEYTGRAWTDDANTSMASPFALINVRAECRGIRLVAGSWESKLRLGAGVTNLFDRKYVSAVAINAVAGRYYEPGSERAFYVAANLSLGRE